MWRMLRWRAKKGPSAATVPPVVNHTMLCLGFGSRYLEFRVGAAVCCILMIHYRLTAVSTVDTKKQDHNPKHSMVCISSS
jgi:hypothetical protein